ncbi:MAG: type II toxin-antitoxin system death-on-curing family toxin [Thermomicrobiales bacterium]
MAEYLSVADVMALHATIMERTGSVPAPLRDEGLLESAVMRPQTASYYEEADLIRQATLLAIGISQNQPFMEGNKRTAYAALDVFLRINGQAYDGNPIALSEQMERVAERSGSLDEATGIFEGWLRKHVSSI